MNRLSLKAIFAFLGMFPILLMGQPEVFSLSDFELRGPVRTCTVLTDYGEERFEFDRDGRLTKSLTRYSDSEYDITYYRYRGPDLSERRDEVYRDGGFDKAASFARFYEYDTLSANVVEKITSYDQLIREQLTYEFDSIGRLERLVRIHQEGIDETQVQYTHDNGEETAMYFLNGQVSKSIRKSEKEGPEGLTRITLTKEYFQEAPQKAVEQVRDSMDHLLLKTRFGSVVTTYGGAALDVDNENDFMAIRYQFRQWRQYLEELHARKSLLKK